MAEAGESSSAAADETLSFWAKLVPIDSRFSDVEIKGDEMVVKSVVTGTDDRNETEWCKILRNSDSSSATIQNISGSSILVDEAVIESGEGVAIRCGSEIVPAPDTQARLAYRFKAMPAPERRRSLRIEMDVDHAKCGICLSVWHDAVTLAPCFHNFCNGCFSEWLRRSQEKRSGAVLCPHCRTVVRFAGRNHFLLNIGEEIVKADPSLRRSDDEVATLDSSASIKSNLVIKTGNRGGRKRSFSQLDDGSNVVDLPCPQCATEFNGFQCNQNNVHLQCQACGGMMPSRPPNTTAPQHCLGCDRSFCGAYWHAQGVTGINSHATCSRETFIPISERTVYRIPFWAHEKNRHEQDITENCIRHMGTTLQDVIAEWTTKLNNREIDRTRMPLNHAEMITSGTHVCNDCYEKLVSFLLYWYRVTTPKYLMPADASAREDCWYGFACRTQHHNEQHARRRNHVCRPTRGSSNP